MDFPSHALGLKDFDFLTVTGAVDGEREVDCFRFCASWLYESFRLRDGTLIGVKPGGLLSAKCASRDGPSVGVHGSAYCPEGARLSYARNVGVGV